MSDELLDRLRAVRPETPTGLLEPDTHLLEEILMEPKNKTPRRLLLVAAAAAAAVGIAVTLPDTSPMKAASPSGTTVAALNMETIAASSAAALTSGRAYVTYTDEWDTGGTTTRGNMTIEFSGDNRATTGNQQSGAERGFTFANKIIDGQFYLQDSDGKLSYWVKDTNYSEGSGTDLFNVDPRTFLDGAANAAAFVDAGTAVVDGVTTRHLKATKLDKLPQVNVGMGPVDTNYTGFDVWVSPDNVIRKIEFGTSRTETGRPGAKAIVIKHEDGTFTKEIDPNDTTPEVTRTNKATYSVTFKNIGEDIAIEAPANPRSVAGQG